jgi:hypothetical protein
MKNNSDVGKNMINFYKLQSVQKYLDKDNDEQLKFTGMKILKHFLIVGKTGAGKSNCLLNYIHLTSLPKKGTFDHIFFCYQTDEALYQYLKDNIDKKQITFIKGVADFPSVDDFADSINEDKKKAPKRYLIIFDDCLNEVNKANIKKIEDYFKIGRKKSITLCFLTQRYFDTSKFVRSQISYVLIASISVRDAKAILKDSGSDLNNEQLMKLFKIATKKQSEDDIPFMKITMIETPINKKYSRNFLDFLAIE